MAALTVPNSGLGATISGLGITTFLTSISSAKIGATPLDITTLSTTGYEKLRPGDLRKLPKVTVEFFWMGAAPPISTSMIPTVSTTTEYVGSLFTITYPLAGSLQGSAFVEDVDFPNCKPGEIMKGSMTIQFDGGATALTFTAA